MQRIEEIQDLGLPEADFPEQDEAPVNAGDDDAGL